MGWNYRICKETHPYELTNGTKGETVVFGIHEAFYNKDGEIWAVTNEPKVLASTLTPVDCESEAECVESIRDQLKLMALALDNPVVDLDTIVYADQ